MSYGYDLGDATRSLAVSTVDILKGKKPQDIPFSQPTKFELVINLKDGQGAGDRGAAHVARQR
jgi:putative ABC transport system substrate-binding protein